MASFSKYRGLFGAPMAADRAADGLSPVAVDAVTPTYKKPSTGKMILGVLGDTLQQFGGGTGTFLQGQNLQRKAVLDAQARQQEAAGKFAGFKQQYDYELAHPKAPTPSELDRNLTAGGVTQSDPRWAQYHLQAAQQAAAGTPFVYDQYNPATGQTEKVITTRGALGGAQSSGPPAAAVAHLQANPALASAFDQKYGAGASQQYLQGGPTQTAPATFR